MPWLPLPTADGDGGPGPSKLHGVLETVANGLMGASVDAIVIVHERWADIVGAELADLARPVGIADGRLKISVAGPAWASHLRWSEGEIVARLAALIGPDQVTGVTVRVDRR